MDSYAELGTLVIWACVHGILRFKKSKHIFVNIFLIRKTKLKRIGYMKQHC